MKQIISLLILFVFLGCSGGGDDPEPVIPPAKKPVAATLTFPNQNSECTEGTNITSTNSTILFKWSASANTDSYKLTLKNLNSKEITNYTSTTNQLSIELLRGTPYSWYITSISNTVPDTATSATWKFYNAGAGTVTYAPFPATGVAPVDKSSMASTSAVTLEWSGSDVDNDIASYDVYFGTATPLPKIGNGLTNTNLTNVTVTSATTYLWYVVTKDKEGNSSNSEIFSFSVQ